jgi:competence protein ComEC
VPTQLLDVLIPTGSRRWLGAATLACLTALAVTGWVPALTVNSGSLNPGKIDSDVVLLTDPRNGPFGEWAVAESQGVRLFLELPPAPISAGDVVRLSGTVEVGTVPVSGRPHQIVKVDEVLSVIHSQSFYRRIGNGLRSRVQQSTRGGGEEEALLAGFLVGDTSGVSPATVDAMKRAGLSHFVAVSGSNVAMYLSMVFLVVFPLGVGVRRRALAGLICLPIFVVATRFEPSVIRASVMAAIVLGSKLFDFGLEFWQVLSVAVVGLLIFDPWLIRSVGFQLSLVATAGVVIGSRWPGVRTGLGRPLALTMGAQLLVAPLLLSHFGSLPLLSPLSNLVAAPLVSAATALSVPGVFGSDLALRLAGVISGMVIQIAHTAAGWPQIGWLGLAGAVVTATLGHLMWRRSRIALSMVVAGLAVLLVFGGGSEPGSGSVTVLDVGQGDAILISGGDGHYALVDGGPDEAILLNRLRTFGVRQLDLVVATHGDADHVAGLAGLFGRVPIGLIWQQSEPHRTSALDQFSELARRYGTRNVTPPVGKTIEFGSLMIEVIGPLRRYQSPNDQSIVLLVKGSKRSMLLTGDIEEVGQNELPNLKFDVLKVPHHGGGTSDREWLSNTGASLAVISVGANRFGHPVDWVLEALAGSGARIERTDQSGSIVVNLNT